MRGLLFVFCIALVGCHGRAEESILLPGAISFGGGAPGWIGGASDYLVAWDGQMDLVLEPRLAPGSSGAPDAFYTRGVNRSDDLFLFIKRRFTGLAPGRGYDARFCAKVVTNLGGQNLIGKAGATTVEPVVGVVSMSGEPYFWMNVDKGLQANAGPDSRLLGRLRAFGDERAGYAATTLCTTEAMPVTADGDGAIWIYAGAESDFEGVGEAYWLRVDVQLTET